jgi:hypothetical protein
MPPGYDASQNVALAVFEWTNNGLGFLKRWPVRRRIARRNPVSDWAYFTSDRRVAEGEAMFYDFQSDLNAVGAASYAGTRFTQLPAGGVLPAATDWKTFLGPLGPASPTLAASALWPRLLQDTFTREPADVPAANFKQIGAHIIAALKIYRSPGRDELLFARSPLGRLRIFKTPEMEGRSVIVAIRDANAVFRTLSVSGTTTWPIIADDLPGGNADLWFLGFEPGIREGDFFMEDAAMEKKTKAKRAKKVEGAPAEQAGQNFVQRGLQYGFGEGRMDFVGALLGMWLDQPHATAEIVNGLTTDIEITLPGRAEILELLRK